MLSTDVKGLRNERGGFYIDPQEATETAIITHAHGDHAHRGMARYICHKDTAPILSSRLGPEINVQTLEYGEDISLGDVRVSLHPAGHILGSSQVRMEANGEVWVVSGDYKRQDDPTCTPFEAVPCDTFVTEATFALPVFQWQEPVVIGEKIMQWWRDAASNGKTAFLFAYSLGKTQRLLKLLEACTEHPGPIYLHPSSAIITGIYEGSGQKFLPYQIADLNAKSDSFPPCSLIIAPPGVYDSRWMKSFKRPAPAQVSGWMQLRGIKRRRGFEQGFVLSDHADWPALMRTINESQAKQIYVTHGYNDILAHYLREQGYDAHELKSLYAGDESA